MPASLSADDRAVVDEAVQDLLEGPRPVDRGPLGCGMAVPGFLILLIAPVLGRRYDISSSVGMPLLVVGIGLLVIGLVMYFSAGGFVRGHYMAAAEAGLRGLEAWDPDTGDRTEALRGATLVLMNAMAAYGVTSSASFDFEAGRNRIAKVMPMVEAVEEYLVEQGSIYRVFTPWPEGEGPGGRE